MPDLRNFDRNASVNSSSGKDVKDTSQLKGEAKDSLSGKNKTEQYEGSFSKSDMGKLGSKPDNN